MKTLNLRSMSWIMALAMMFIVSFTGCSDDDEEGASAPVFPESKSISCNAGETKEFTFDANLNWKLTSTAIWCKFVKDGADEVALSGSAGKQTITIKATDDDQKPGEAGVAKIELEMGNKKAVIAEVTRSAIGFELKIYDAEGKEIKQLELGYQTYIPFKVKANFRFAASDFPEWVALENGSLVGVANKEVQGGLKIVEDQQREKYPIEARDENAITFSDEAGKASFSFPVFYKGMTPGKIDIKTPTNNRYGWTVSLDGKTFIQGDATTESTTTTIQEQMSFTITTAEDKYEIVFLEKTGRNTMILMDPSNKWIQHTGNDGNVNLTVKPLDPEQDSKQERTGYVLALTKDDYENIKNDLISTLTTNTAEGIDIAYKYQQANLMIQVTQKEIKDNNEVSFSAVNGKTFAPIECTLYEGENAEELRQKYGMQNIWEIEQPTEHTIITASFEFDFDQDLQCKYLNDETKTADGIIEPWDGKIQINAEKAEGKDIVLIFNKANVILIVKISKIGTGESQAVFSVTDNMMQPTTCTQYNGNDISWITGAYNVNAKNIWEITTPFNAMNMISLLSGNITELTCYNFDKDSDNEVEFNLNDSSSDIAKNGDSGITVWLGGGTSIDYNIAILVTTDNSEKYLLIIRVNQD